MKPKPLEYALVLFSITRDLLGENSHVKKSNMCNLKKHANDVPTNGAAPSIYRLEGGYWIVFDFRNS